MVSIDPPVNVYKSAIPIGRVWDMFYTCVFAQSVVGMKCELHGVRCFDVYSLTRVRVCLWVLRLTNMEMENLFGIQKMVFTGAMPSRESRVSFQRPCFR